MHSVLLRIKIVKSNNIYEVYFDDRLSFKENIQLLNNINLEIIGDVYVYDPIKKIFIDDSIPIKDFNISGFMMFDLLERC